MKELMGNLRGPLLIAQAEPVPNLLPGWEQLSLPMMLTQSLSAPIKEFVIEVQENVRALKTMKVLHVNAQFAQMPAVKQEYALQKSNWLKKLVQPITLLGMPKSMLDVFAILVAVDLTAP